MINLQVGSITKKDNLYVKSDETLRHVIELMNINQEGVVVVLEDNKPVGIITEKDIMEIYHKNFNLDEKICFFTKKILITTKEDRTLGHALNLMLENNIRRLAVTDDTNNFLGIITQQNILKHLEDDYYRSTLKVKHILCGLRSLISVSEVDNLSDVLTKMVTNKISSVPIIKDRKAIGIITEKDILQLAVRNVRIEDNVFKYMSSPVIAANFETSLVDIVKIMNYQKIRRIAINSNEGFTIYMLTIKDVLNNIEGDYSKFLERKLRNAKDLLNVLPEMFMEVTDTGKEQLIIWANKKVINKFGRDIIDEPITSLVPKENWDEIYKSLTELHRIEGIMFQNDNAIYEMSGCFIKTDEIADKGRLQLIMKDMTESVKLSNTDSLTGVYNRRYINDFLSRELARSNRLSKQFSLVMIDIDNFKGINDIYGHVCGDLVLTFFSNILTNTFREVDVVGRYGGDEFIIIMPETSYEMASHAVDRLKLNLKNTEILLQEGCRKKLAASFGIATYPKDGLSSDVLIVTSDKRLYGSKSKKTSCKSADAVRQLV